MKKLKILSIALILFVSIFSSACSVEDWTNDGKYGTFSLGVKNVENYIGDITLLEGDGFTDSFSEGQNTGFLFTAFLSLNDNIEKVKENVEIVYVVDLVVDYYDNAGNKQKKDWEGIEFGFLFEVGDKGSSESKTLIKNATDSSMFGVSVSQKKIYYADVASCIKVTLTPVYIKSVKGKIFIDRPA